MRTTVTTTVTVTVKDTGTDTIKKKRKPLVRRSSPCLHDDRFSDWHWAAECCLFNFFSVVYYREKEIFFGVRAVTLFFGGFRFTALYFSLFFSFPFYFVRFCFYLDSNVCVCAVCWACYVVQLNLEVVSRFVLSCLRAFLLRFRSLRLHFFVVVLRHLRNKHKTKYN